MHPRALGRIATVVGAAALCVPVPGVLSKQRGGSAQVPAAIAMNPGDPWCLQLSSEDLVAFRGLEEADPNALGSGAMLYPAPSPVAFVAAVATHAAIVGGVRAKQAREHAEAANKVLEPYQAVLGGFRSQELEDRTLDARTPDGAKSLACGADRTASSWTIESAPLFFMSQDQTALVLDNVATIHPPGTSTTIYRHALRVVSKRLSTDPPAPTWLADDGAKLKAEAVVLFGQSLDVVLMIAAGDPVPPDAPFKSFHYYQGSSDKVERAQLVSETCERLLLKTLRATFLSVPTMRSDCASDGRMPPSETAQTPH